MDHLAPLSGAYDARAAGSSQHVFCLRGDGPAGPVAGAIDMHAHGDPDGAPRKVDVVALARAAKAAGMRAVVLKNHYVPTASLAYLVRQIVPGIEVFGGISLASPSVE